MVLIRGNSLERKYSTLNDIEFLAMFCQIYKPIVSFFSLQIKTISLYFSKDNFLTESRNLALNEAVNSENVWRLLRNISVDSSH